MTHASHKPDLPQIGERAFTEVLATFLSLPATPRTPSAQTPVAPPDQLAATVLLGGKGLSGTVRVLLPVPFVAQAVKQLTGLEGTEGEAVHEDAAGEIANMRRRPIGSGRILLQTGNSFGLPYAGFPTGAPSRSGSGSHRVNLRGPLVVA
jgi:hypothetical protein